MKLHKFFSLLIISTIALSACNNSTNTTSEEDTGNDSLLAMEHTKKVKKIFYNVPSPIEMASLMQRSGAIYIPEILNKHDKYKDYIGISKQALNLGVYGTDLSYVRLFDQISLSIKYLKSIKHLCDELNIPEEQGSLALSRLEENINNRDSILQIISETYASADNYLKESSRGNTATLIILGGWIEALYIATNILKTNDFEKNDISKRIAEQKFSLSNLVELVKSYPEDKDLQEFIVPLNELLLIYQDVEITYTPGEVVTDKETKTTTINSDAKIKITPETIQKIKVKVAEIRASIINF